MSVVVALIKQILVAAVITTILAELVGIHHVPRTQLAFAQRGSEGGFSAATAAIVNEAAICVVVRFTRDPAGIRADHVHGPPSVQQE